MTFKQNIGIINALIRITLGFTFLAWATAKLIKKPWCESYLFVILMASMKIAEGIVRYCPVTDLIENTNMMSTQTNGQEKIDDPSFFPYNPT